VVQLHTARHWPPVVNEDVTPGMYSPAHIIDTPVHANQGTGSHVPDETIVLDGKIASRELPHLPIATGTVGRGIGRHGEVWFECECEYGAGDLEYKINKAVISSWWVSRTANWCLVLK